VIVKALFSIVLYFRLR